MEKIKPVIVLAGKYSEFSRATNGNPHFVFGESFEKMAGIEASAVIVIGTFWLLKDARELYGMAQSRIR